jgi:hypothetical protein
MTTEDKDKNGTDTDSKPDGIPTFVTPLQPIASQVGEHVMTALEQDDTVAVLTTITGSGAGNQVVSIPLTAEQLHQVHGLIQEIHDADEPERIPCVGFHCFIDEPDETED